MIRLSDGTVPSKEREKMIQQAMAAIRTLTDQERIVLLCWFCSVCGKFIGPGEPHCKHEYNT